MMVQEMRTSGNLQLHVPASAAKYVPATANALRAEAAESAPAAETLRLQLWHLLHKSPPD
jgi:hypothetical protein